MVPERRETDKVIPTFAWLAVWRQFLDTGTGKEWSLSMETKNRVLILLVIFNMS